MPYTLWVTRHGFRVCHASLATGAFSPVLPDYTRNCQTSPSHAPSAKAEDMHQDLQTSNEACGLQLTTAPHVSLDPQG